MKTHFAKSSASGLSSVNQEHIKHSNFEGHEPSFGQMLNYESKTAPDNVQAQSYPEKWVCLHPNCDKVYSRIGDLRRHYLTHRTGPKGFDCPWNGCVRKGLNGFWRSDKLRDHLICKHGVDRDGRLIATGVVVFPTLHYYLVGRLNEATPFERLNNLPIGKYPFATSFWQRYRSQPDATKDANF